VKYAVYKSIKVSDDYSIFEFISRGKQGDINKRIEFMPTDTPNYYNLAFGDVDESGEINDYSISNNGDRNMILATVAYAVEIYLDKHPERWVYFSGSTEERTRLYRMAIGLNFDELKVKFDIYAEIATSIVPFERNIDALGIVVKKKT
jgi:hypothetical protein